MKDNGQIVVVLNLCALSTQMYDHTTIEHQKWLTIEVWLHVAIKVLSESV